MMRTVESHELEVGRPVVWMHQPRGGYGYVLPTVVTVARISESGKRITIRVKTTRGEIVERHVKPESLRLPDNWTPPASQA